MQEQEHLEQDLELAAAQGITGSGTHMQPT